MLRSTRSQGDRSILAKKSTLRALAKTLKGYFPRLPICITADGLYPNRTFFDICRDNQWDFILTFKEGNLPSVWEEIGLLPPSATQHRTHTFKNNTQEITRTYSWINGIDYHGHCLNWIECKEEIQPRDTAEKKEGRIHSQALAALLQSDAKLTLKHLWKQLLGYMTHYDIDPSPLHALSEKRAQIRLC